MAFCREDHGRLEYFPGTDTLYISLSDEPGADAEEVAEDFVIDYAKDGRPIGIEIEHASERLDLTKLETHSLPVAG